MTSIWPEFGYRESLYATTPIPATAEGENLLVGRERELRQLKIRLSSSTLHPTIEGENGVGKTSLVAVAGYQLAKAFRNHNSAQAFVPLRRTFQLTPSATVGEFRREVLLEVAQAMIDNFEDLKGGGLALPDVTDMKKWMTRAVQRSSNFGVSVAGYGLSLGSATQVGSGRGFNESGYAALIETWLRTAFPSPQSGGFLAVIDNLELLQTHRTARTLLEGLRDEVLALPGIRWVLCGSRGIVLTAASSTRLEGRLSEPIVLGALPERVAPDVVAARRDCYRVADWAVAPVGRRAFRHLYDVLNHNLRNALRYADQFSTWLSESCSPPWSEGQNDRLLEAWLTDQSDRHLEESRLGMAAWTVFDRLVQMGGSCSPSDYGQFGYSSSMALRPQVKALEDANLIDSAIDDVDRRRKTISVSPRGWLVQYSRAGYPQGID